MRRKHGLRPLDTWSKKDREELYRQTKAEVKNYHHIAQTTRLLKKEKKEREVDEQLQKKRHEIDDKRKEIDREHEELQRTILQHRGEIDSKKGFILNLDAEISNEGEKGLREETQIKQKEEEIKRKEKELGEVKEILQATKTKINAYEEYRTYLKGVVEDSEDYENIQHLMDRYRTLKNNADKLKMSQKQTEELTNREKLESNKLKKEREEIEMKNTTVRSLEKEIEDQKNKLASLQSNKESKERQKILEKGIAGKVILSLENIHSKVAELRPGATKGLKMPQVEPLAAIREIHKRILDLKAIVELKNEQDSQKEHQKESQKDTRKDSTKNYTEEPVTSK